MLGFKIWSRFGVFRDPLTITQNITFPLPPKTTIGGIMAAVLGIDYNDYFCDPEYFLFEYSAIPLNPVRKKSFAQNYVKKYTERGYSKINAIRKINNLEKLGKNESLALKNFKFQIEGSQDYKTATAPIFRELLCDPAYLIFIRNYKHEEKLKRALEDHTTGFALYMGNSEFPANIAFIPITSSEILKGSVVDSFTTHPDLIEFEVNKRYTNLHFATLASDDREYSQYRKIIFSESGVLLKEPVEALKITTENKTYVCEFI